MRTLLNKSESKVEAMAIIQDLMMQLEQEHVLTLTEAHFQGLTAAERIEVRARASS